MNAGKYENVQHFIFVFLEEAGEDRNGLKYRAKAPK